MQFTTNHFWRWYGVLFLCLSTWYLFTQRKAIQVLALAKEPLTPAQQENLPSTSIAILFILIAIIFVIFTFAWKPSKMNPLHLKFPILLSWGLTIVIVAGCIAYLFLTTRTALWNVSGRLSLFVLLAGIGGWLLSKTTQPILPIYGFSLLLLIAGVLYRIGLFFPEFQNTPFALGWSEGSRYYNSSLFFSKHIYGSSFPLPVLHPSRYLLQSLAFLFSPDNILIHRIWQVVLWIGVTGLGAYSIARRFSPKNRLALLAVMLWLFLFFFQGSVYYHLMVCVLVVMFGYNKDSFWKTLTIILIASAWAGLSRVNWYPVPALLAVCLYLIEEPIKDQKWLSYLKKPVIWTISGSMTAFLINRIYAALSGNDVGQFSTSFSSYMIWSRLLPNATFPPGIVLAFLLVSFPMAILCFWVIRKNGWKFYWHWIRILGLAGILAVFAIGGIIVSVKIGGGGDLHNLDAFLVFYALITSSICLNMYASQSGDKKQDFHFPLFTLFPILFVPLFFTLQYGGSWNIKDIQSQNAEVQLIQKAIDSISTTRSGSILLISERQLLTFGALKDVDLVPDYEKVFLMEMVMANNKPYLELFHEKLQEETYSAIIVDSLSEVYQKKNESFWVENNLWVDQVIIPLLLYYEPVYSLHEGTVNVLIPRGNEELYNQLKKLGK